MNARIALCLAALLSAGPAFAQTRGQLLLPEFEALSKKASESVSVRLDANLLGMACRFLNSEEPDQLAAKKLCTSLTGIYVRHYSFDTDYAYPKSEIDSLRKQLNTPSWSRIVEAKSNKEKTDVDVFVMLDMGKARGLAIIASEPREFTIVNIVGNIDLEQLHDLEGNFGVPKLEIDTGKKPAPRK